MACLRPSKIFLGAHYCPPVIPDVARGRVVSIPRPSPSCPHGNAHAWAPQAFLLTLPKAVNVLVQCSQRSRVRWIRRRKLLRRSHCCLHVPGRPHGSSIQPSSAREFPPPSPHDQGTMGKPLSKCRAYNGCVWTRMVVPVLRLG